MQRVKQITSASVACLLIATSSTMASDKPPTHKKLSKQPVSNKKIAAPKPVNVAHKYFGLGPDSRIQINGFMSAGMSTADADHGAKYEIPGHGQVGDNLSFAPNSLAGIQVTGNITPQLAAVLQLKATGEDANGEHQYRPTVDWAFIRYKLNKEAQVRVGRMRIPAFLYSQTEEIGVTYIPVILPPEVYRILPFNNFNGIDFTYNANLGDSNWSLKLNPMFGENTSQFDLYVNQPLAVPYGTTATFHENYMMGGAAELSNQYVTLHASYLRTTLSMDLPAFTSPVQGPLPVQKGVISNKMASFYNFGGKIDYHNFVAVGEFAHRDTPVGVASLSGYYGLVGYRIQKLLPYISYARLWTTSKEKIQSPTSEREQAQKSITAGASYSFSANLVGKIGVSRITPLDGTTGLFTPELTKKHVMLYTASLDIIF